MARRETLKQFIDKLPKFSSSLDKLNQARFNVQAIQTLDDAKERAPLASGTLVDSGSVKRVSIKSGTLEVQWIFNVPYAIELDNPKSGLNLKNKGKISLYVGGQKIRKKRKGILGFLTKTVKRDSKIFEKILFQNIKTVFDRL